MGKKTPLERLGNEIEKIVAKYVEDATTDAKDLAKAFAKKGERAVSREASGKGWGEHTGYAQGWTSTVEEDRFSAVGIIHNQKTPGLAHLLEKGHALRNGGRSKAYPHIAPVEEKLIEEYTKALEETL